VIFKHHLLVLLATALVAGSFLASEKIAGIINPFSLTLLRNTGAFALLVPIVLSKSRWRNKIVSTLPRAIVISFFYTAFFICLFESLNTTTSLNTGALFTLVPFITACMSIFVFKENITKQQLVVYALGVIGACWIIFGRQLESLLAFSINKGDIIFMAGALSMCCYTIAMKLLYRNDEVIVLVFCTLLGGSFWMMLAVLILGQPLQWDAIPGDSLLYMAYLITGATLVTVYLYQKATIILGPGRVNAYIYLTPALVAIQLFLIQGVSIPVTIIPGILISSIATVILQKSSTQEAVLAPK